MSLRRFACGTLAAGLLAGCADVQVHHVKMDPSRLRQGEARERVACPYRIVDVEDARPGGDRAGGLGEHMFKLDDVAKVVQQGLLDAGLSETTGTPVRLRIVQFYLAQNTITKIPTVVYELRIAEGPAVVIRSQLASMNWWGSEGEGYRAYAAAMQDSIRQVAARLDAACAASAAAAPALPAAETVEGQGTQ